MKSLVKEFVNTPKENVVELKTIRDDITFISWTGNYVIYQNKKCKLLVHRFDDEEPVKELVKLQ